MYIASQQAKGTAMTAIPSIIVMCRGIMLQMTLPCSSHLPIHHRLHHRQLEGGGAAAAGLPAADERAQQARAAWGCRIAQADHKCLQALNPSWMVWYESI